MAEPQYLVRYFAMNTSPRNTGIAVVFGEWPERVLRHRGYTEARRAWTRLATAEENAWLASCHRFQALWYVDVEKLLEDEREIVAPDVFDKLAPVLRQRCRFA